MASREQERLRIYPPTRHHRSIPLSLEDAQAHIANYIALADIRENTHLHPDAQITPSGINRSSQGGSAGGLILSHLRRVQKGLNGERIEVDIKSLNEDWEKDTRAEQSEDTRLDALIAQDGYGGEKKKEERGAEGKKAKRKREEMEAQADSVTVLDPSRRQDEAHKATHPKGLGQPNDIEGWQTMESYQREIEDEELEEGDIGQRHNFRQQTMPEPKVQDTDIHLKQGAEGEVGKEVQQDLQAGKDKAKKKRKRDEEGPEKGTNIESQDWATKDTGHEERKKKKAKTESTEWSFDHLKANPQGQDKSNDVVKQKIPAETSVEIKKPKEEKVKKEKKPKQPDSRPLGPDTTSAESKIKKDRSSSSMPPPRIVEPNGSQTNGSGTSAKPKDSKLSNQPKKSKSDKNNKPAGVSPSKMTDLMLQSLQRKSPMPARPSSSPSPASALNGDTKPTVGRNPAVSPDTSKGSTATPLLDPSQTKKKKDKSKGDRIADEAYAEAQTNGALPQPSPSTANSQQTDEKTSEEKTVKKKKVKKERDKQQKQEKEKG